MKNKLQEYALVAEIISAACIVLSLIFVGFQIQQGARETAMNSEAVRSTVRQSMMNADLSIQLWLGSTPTVWDPEMNGTVAQSVSRRLYFHSLLRTRSNYWSEYKNGLLDEEILNSYLSPLVLQATQAEWFLNLWNDFYANPDSYPQDMLDEINKRIFDILNN